MKQFSSIIFSDISKLNEKIFELEFIESIVKILVINNYLEMIIRILFIDEYKNKLIILGTSIESFQNSSYTFDINMKDFRAKMIISFSFDRNLS